MKAYSLIKLCKHTEEQAVQLQCVPQQRGGGLQVYFYKLNLKLNFRTQLSGYLFTVSFVRILRIC